LRVRDAQDLLANQTGRAPTVSQLAQYLELDGEEVIDALQPSRPTKRSRSMRRLAELAPRRSSCPNGDAVGQDDEHYELVELGATVNAALEHLPGASGSC